MKHVKKSAFLVAVAAFGFFLLFALTEGMTPLLIFPIIALAAFAVIYLVKQGQKDIENNIKDGVRYTVEDQEAEQWIKHDLAPHTLSYIKHKHWPIIIYGLLFVIGVSYLWSYITIGHETALLHTVYAALLFFIFSVYAIFAPRLFNALFQLVPKHYRKYVKNDWMRGYLFLLPLTTVAYILSPFVGGTEPVAARIAGLPGFLLGYTFLFLCGFAVLYLHRETKKEEENQLKKSMKDYLNNKN